MRGIYKIENKVNRKVYIGESLDIEVRWIKHIEDLNNNKHHSYKLQSDWNKYGDNNFEFTIIAVLDDRIKKLVDRHLLFLYENRYINKFNSIEDGYNIEDTLIELMSGNKRVVMVQIHLLKEYKDKIERKFYIEDNGVIRTDYHSMEEVEKALGIKRQTLKVRMIKLNMVVKKDKDYVLNKEYFNKNDMGSCIYGSARFNADLYNQLINELSTNNNKLK